MGFLEITKRLFGLKGGQVAGYRPAAKVPDDHRLYAIGDIHGRYDLLQLLLTKVDADAESFEGQTTLVFLGDYVDRGPQSKAVLDFLIELERVSRHELVFLLGNHEQTMLDFLADAPASEHWLRYGGLETLASYGVQISSEDLSKSSLSRVRSTLRDNLDASHLDFLRRLRLSYEQGDYYFAHAGVRPDIDLNAQILDDLLWIREPFLSSTRDFGRIIVHGHSISEEPVVRRNRIGIDTGAFASGRLTALVLEGEERRFLTTA